MLHKSNSTIIAVSCKIAFLKEGRLVVLGFNGLHEQTIDIRLTDALMAEVTGHFLRERLFGLH